MNTDRTIHFKNELNVKEEQDLQGFYPSFDKIETEESKYRLIFTTEDEVSYIKSKA